MRRSRHDPSVSPAAQCALDTTELGPVLRLLTQWLRLRDGLLTASRTLWLPLVASILVLTAGHLRPIEHLTRWAIMPPALWAILVVAWALLRPLPPYTVARRADALLELKERLSTAVVLRAQGTRGNLVDRQWDDAVALAGQIKPHRDLGFRVDSEGIRRAMVAVVAVVVLLVAGNPMDQVLERRAAVREAAQVEAKRVEAVRDDVAEETTPTSEERAQALHALAELARQLQANPGSPEQALADLAQAEDVLHAQQDLRADAREASLMQLTEQLANLAASELGQDTAGQPTQDDLARALVALSAAKQKEAAARLEQLASSLDAVAPGDATASDLARSLEELARAARSGDPVAVEQAAAAVDSALTRAQREQALQQALEQALAQLQRSRETVASAAQRGPAATERADAGQSGQSQGQAPGQGQTGGGGGTSARQLPPSARSGQADDPTGPAREPAVGELDEIYAPRIEGSAGDVDALSGIPTDEGESQIRRERQPLPGGTGAARVPYTEVFPAYREAASAAMEREYVPPGLRDYVKEYFSRLDPGTEDATDQDE